MTNRKSVAECRQLLAAWPGVFTTLYKESKDTQVCFCCGSHILTAEGYLANDHAKIDLANLTSWFDVWLEMEYGYKTWSSFCKAYGYTDGSRPDFEALADRAKPYNRPQITLSWMPMEAAKKLLYPDKEMAELVDSYTIDDSDVGPATMIWVNK